MAGFDNMSDEPKVVYVEKPKDKTVVGEVMKHGGGAVTGGLLGGAVAAPLVIWGLGVIAAPFTGGVSLGVAAAATAATAVAGAVVGHQMSKKIDE
jgi:hypothetical protein